MLITKWTNQHYYFILNKLYTDAHKTNLIRVGGGVVEVAVVELFGVWFCDPDKDVVERASWAEVVLRN